MFLVSLQASVDTAPVVKKRKYTGSYDLIAKSAYFTAIDMLDEEALNTHLAVTVIDFHDVVN